MDNSLTVDDVDQPLAPTLGELFVVCLRVGLLSFGGPAAQIALMHREFVEERRWLNEPQYLNALSFCMLLPGPEAMQLATYVGWRLHGTLGGLIAGLLFVLPGAAVMLGLVSAYVFYGDLPLVNAMFLGVKAAVIVIVVEALLRVSRKALTRVEDWLVAAVAFVGIFFLALPFPLIIAAAAILGFVRTSPAPQASAPVTVKVSLSSLHEVTLAISISKHVQLGLAAHAAGIVSQLSTVEPSPRGVRISHT